jgi:hypothetical protein
MAAFDPNAPPFYEQQRGGGPITHTMEFQAEMARREEERLARLRDPRLVPVEEFRDVLDMRRKRISGRSYKQRRALGLCTVCEAPTRYARCDTCRKAYNLRPSRRKAWR